MLNGLRPPGVPEVFLCILLMRQLLLYFASVWLVGMGDSESDISGTKSDTHSWQTLSPPHSAGSCPSICGGNLTAPPFIPIPLISLPQGLPVDTEEQGTIRLHLVALFVQVRSVKNLTSCVIHFDQEDMGVDGQILTEAM